MLSAPYATCVSLFVYVRGTFILRCRKVYAHMVPVHVGFVGLVFRWQCGLRIANMIEVTLPIYK